MNHSFSVSVLEASYIFLLMLFYTDRHIDTNVTHTPLLGDLACSTVEERGGEGGVQPGSGSGSATLLLFDKGLGPYFLGIKVD